MKRLFSLILLFAFLLSACQSAPAPTQPAPTEIHATDAPPTPTPLPTEIPPTPTHIPAPPLPEGFVHAQGRDLFVGESQTPIRLTGVNFAAYGWGSPEDLPDKVYRAKDFRQIDYFRVADMGMNVIRLNVWYQLFEHDYYPYVYDRPGWEWLDQQIAWAKEARVYIILSMMRPQPSFQGPDYEGNFWDDDPYYRDRLKALWVEIGTRYKDETQIAAYDVINEPNTNGRPQLWEAYAQDLTDAIRTVDSNHLLDLQQEVGENFTAFLVDDPAKNVMYDIHCYQPYYFSTQFVNRGYQGKYGDPLTPIMPWDWDIDYRESFALAAVPEGDSDWVLYESKPVLIDDAEIIGAQPVFVLPTDGQIFFDDLFVTEYAPDGTSQVLMNVALEYENLSSGLYYSDTPYTLYNWNFLTVDGVWKPANDGNTLAHNGNSSLSFASSSAPPRLNFPVRQGHSYSVSGWMKGEGVSGDGGLTLRLADWRYGGMVPLTKETIEQRLLDPSIPDGNYRLQFYIDADVPVNVGEWGLSPYAFTPERGGKEYVRDMLALFEKYHLNSQYWVYSRFGNYFIYQNAGPGYYAWPGPENANQPLIDLLTEILKP